MSRHSSLFNFKQSVARIGLAPEPAPEPKYDPFGADYRPLRTDPIALMVYKLFPRDPRQDEIIARIADECKYLNDSPDNLIEDYRPGWDVEGLSSVPMAHAACDVEGGRS